MAEIRPTPNLEVRNSSSQRLRLRVNGVVQGVGFRPYVHRLATQNHLSGFVLNDNAGVLIEIEGTRANLDAFQVELPEQAPPTARIEEISATQISPLCAQDFVVVESQRNTDAQTFVSPDLAICDDCLRELFDPDDRRYRYPFINCTNCGPRYTIIRDLPYDRPLTTMADFALCPDCQRDFHAPDNRRFHAQPNACPNCGPQLEFHWLGEKLPAPLARRFAPSDDAPMGENGLQIAQRLLAHGGIIAIKGIGGFHLACDATNDRTVGTLRQLKRRGDKPFAIMARDLASVLRIAHVDATEIALLTGRERPIVLLRKRANTSLSGHIAPGNHLIGVMLPYAPLHHLLFAPLPSPTAIEPPPWLVMTSANHAGEPIITDNEVAQRQLSELADGILLHNRPIIVPCDDSVVRVVEGHSMPIRRARGYAPLPIRIPAFVPPTLGVGGELKNASCLAQGHHAFMSQHLGDMATFETQSTMTRAVEHLESLFRIKPAILACDLHPGYHSTRWAKEWVARQLRSVELIQVQHHHAHIAALMAEHRLSGDRPVIGFCFDGTGYGPDGAIWGGEVLLANYNDFERAAHLAYLPLPGGDAAIRKPYRMALAALWAVGIGWDESLPSVNAASPTELQILRRQLETGLNCIRTSSIGRLFDIIAALCGVRQIVTYEAQAAIELEGLTRATSTSYRFAMPTSSSTSFDAAPIIRAVVADYQRGVAPIIIASRFHNAIVNLIVEQSVTIRTRTGLNQVGLTGGVFQNHFLLQHTVRRLQDARFETLIHRSVPPNDGGLALGQVMVAAHHRA